MFTSVTKSLSLEIEARELILPVLKKYKYCIIHIQPSLKTVSKHLKAEMIRRNVMNSMLYFMT
jgi:hypothetical protein